MEQDSSDRSRTSPASGKGISRRSFLRMSGAAVATLPLLQLHLVARAEEDDETPFLHIAYMRKWNDLNWDVHYDSGSEVMPDYPTIYLPLVLRND